MSNFWVWVFRGLVAIAAGLVVISFIMPWWTANLSIVPIQDPIRIYAYGLRHDMVQLAKYVAADETPFYQSILAFIYLGASVGLMLLSTWLKGKKGGWLLGGVGLVYIGWAVVAVILVAIRTGDFGASLQGQSKIITGEAVTPTLDASLRFGYYLAYAAGLITIALALIRSKMLGTRRAGA